MKHIIIASDAWEPQINGVVRTLNNTVDILRRIGHKVSVINPYLFKTIPVPFYKEIPIALCYNFDKINNVIEDIDNTYFHIATEGNVGRLLRRFCHTNNYRYTTAYHTMFPEYLQKILRIPPEWSYYYFKRFHQRSSCVMVPNNTLIQKLNEYGFNNVNLWSRGVDIDVFHPCYRPPNEKPVLVFVGRVSHEKNIEEFLKIEGNYTKKIIGDGPLRHKLENQYPDVIFTGYKQGYDLKKEYCSADVFVFPSKTDTFGLVMLEALACGVPVAAFPVNASLDIFKNQSGVGFLNNNLKIAIDTAIKEGDKVKSRQFALNHSWEKWTDVFSNYLVKAKNE